MKYSVVIPVYNEERNVGPLHAELLDVMRGLDGDFEILFVNDGSVDGTTAALATLSPATVIELRGNFGQTAAIDAGIKHAQGEIIITLDGDGQNPPGEIPAMLELLESEKLDVVSGWRKHRNDPLRKRFVSRTANLLRSIFFRDTIHDSGCTLKVYRRECFNNVDLFGEMHRFIPAILSWSGFQIGEMVVEHRQRQHGQSKYTWKRMLKGFIDIIAIVFWRRYANRPLHLFGAIGILFTFGGFVLGIIVAIRRLVYLIPMSNSSLPLLSVFLFVLGIQFFLSGILADIAIRTYYSKRTPYNIKGVTQQ